MYIYLCTCSESLAEPIRSIPLYECIYEHLSDFKCVTLKFRCLGSPLHEE